MPAAHSNSSRWSQSALVREQWSQFQDWLQHLRDQTVGEYEIKYASGRQRLEALPRIERLRAQQSFDLWAEQLREQTELQRAAFAQIEWERRLKSADLGAADWIMSENERKAYAMALGGPPQYETKISDGAIDGAHFAHPFQLVDPSEFGLSTPRQQHKVDDKAGHPRRASGAGIRPNTKAHRQSSSSSSSPLHERQHKGGRDTMSFSGFDLDRRLNQNRLIQEHCRLGKQVDEECCRIEADYWNMLFKIRLGQIDDVWLQTEATLNTLVQEKGQAQVSKAELENIMEEYRSSKKKLEEDVTAEKQKLLATEKCREREAIERAAQHRPGPVQWRELFEQLFRSHDISGSRHNDQEVFGRDHHLHQGSRVNPSGGNSGAPSTSKLPAASNPPAMNTKLSTGHTRHPNPELIATGSGARSDVPVRQKNSPSFLGRKATAAISKGGLAAPNGNGGPAHSQLPPRSVKMETAIDDRDRMDTDFTNTSTKGGSIPPSPGVLRNLPPDVTPKRQTLMGQHAPAIGGYKANHPSHQGGSRSNTFPETFEDEVGYSVPSVDPYHTSMAGNVHHSITSDNLDSGGWFSHNADGFNWDEVTGEESTTEYMREVRWATDIIPDGDTNGSQHGQPKSTASAVVPGGCFEAAVETRGSERFGHRISGREKERLHAEIMEFMNDEDATARTTAQPRCRKC